MNVSTFRRDGNTYNIFESSSSSSPWTCVAVDDSPGDVRRLLSRLVKNDICAKGLSIPFSDDAINLLNGNVVEVENKIFVKVKNTSKCILLLDMNNEEDYKFEGYEPNKSNIAGAQFWSKIRDKFSGKVIILSNYLERVAKAKTEYNDFAKLEDYYKNSATGGINKKVEDKIIKEIVREIESNKSLVDLEVDEWEELVRAGEGFETAHHLPPKGAGNINQEGWIDWVQAKIDNTNIYNILRDSGYDIPGKETPNLNHKPLWGYNELYPRLRDIAVVYPERKLDDNPLKEYLKHCREFITARYGMGKRSSGISADLDLTVPPSLRRYLGSEEFDYLGFNVVALAKLIDCMAAGLMERINDVDQGILIYRVDIDSDTDGCSLLVSIEEPNFSIPEPAFQSLPDSTRGEHRGGHMSAIFRYASILRVEELLVINEDMAKTINLDPENGYSVSKVGEYAPPAPGFVLKFKCPFILRS